MGSICDCPMRKPICRAPGRGLSDPHSGRKSAPQSRAPRAESLQLNSIADLSAGALVRTPALARPGCHAQSAIPLLRTNGCQKMLSRVRLGNSIAVGDHVRPLKRHIVVCQSEILPGINSQMPALSFTTGVGL